MDVIPAPHWGLPADCLGARLVAVFGGRSLGGGRRVRCGPPVRRIVGARAGSRSLSGTEPDARHLTESLTTDEVYEVPALVVPPTINKFYALDLAPDRSLVEFGVGQGRQMFVISWRTRRVL